jgi:hypothetical protein
MFLTTGCELIMWTSYEKIQKERMEAYYKDEFLPSKFKDVILFLDDHSTLFQKRIIITTYHNGSYGMLRLDKKTFSFINQRDSIIKNRNQAIFTLKKSDGKTHSFTVEFCD